MFWHAIATFFLLLQLFIAKHRNTSYDSLQCQFKQ